MKVYKEISTRLLAMENCLKSNNNEWYDAHKRNIEMIIKEHFPHGSGFDSGTGFEFDDSNSEKLVFYTSFHHMNQDGYYDGWTTHSIIVTPSLSFDFNIRITGSNRNDIKDYITGMFFDSLTKEIIL